MTATGTHIDNLVDVERPAPAWRGAALALTVLALGLGAAVLGHRLVPQLGILSWAICLGALVGNIGVLPRAGTRQLRLFSQKLLQAGIVLLGFSATFASIAALGLPLIGVVALGLVSTLVFTTWLGNRMGLGRARSLLIGTSFAISGTSAIGAIKDTAGAEEEDMTATIAMVTLFGTAAVVLLPLLAGPLGLSDLQFGAWTGASVHEVGQVVLAASPAGAAVVAIAVAVKFTRVMMLAPVAAVLGVIQRVKSPAVTTASTDTARTPLVPLFVLGFLACVALRSTGIVPGFVLGQIPHLQVAALGAASFGVGCSVHLATVFTRGAAVMVVSALGTLFIATVTLAGIVLVTH